MDKKRQLILLAIPLIVILGLVLIFRNAENTAGKSFQQATTSIPTPPLNSQPLQARQTIYFYSSELVASVKESTITYHHSDHIRTISLTTDQAGGLKSRTQTYPYGKTLQMKSTSTGVQKYKYTGKEDDGKLMYYGARYYDPRIGRFTSVDPIQSTYASYDYAGSNPLRNVDPDGRGINEVKDLCEGMCYGTAESIARFPEAIGAFMQDPVGSISQMPGQFASAARASFPEGSYGGFGTGQNAFAAGQAASSVVLTLLGLSYTAGGSLPRINLQMPQLAVATAGEAAMPLLVGGSIEVTGGSSLAGGTALAMAKHDHRKHQAEPASAPSTPKPTREQINAPYRTTNFKELLNKAANNREIVERLNSVGLEVEHTTGKYRKIFDSQGRPIRRADGSQVEISSSPHDDWTTVANQVGRDMNRAVEYQKPKP